MLVATWSYEEGLARVRIETTTAIQSRARSHHPSLIAVTLATLVILRSDGLTANFPMTT